VPDTDPGSFSVRCFPRCRLRPPILAVSADSKTADPDPKISPGRVEPLTLMNVPTVSPATTASTRSDRSTVTAAVYWSVLPP
jgi:hypothetical protein